MSDSADYPVTISEDYRSLTVPQTEQVLGCVGDVWVRRVYFTAPQYCDGTDMSAYTFQVNFRNANGEEGTYAVTDLATGDDDTLTFSWLVSPTATAYEGKTQVSVLAYVTEDDEVTYRFCSTTYEWKVLPSTIASDDYVTEYSDTVTALITTWQAAVDAAVAECEEATEAASVVTDEVAAIETALNRTFVTVSPEFPNAGYRDYSNGRFYSYSGAYTSDMISTDDVTQIKFTANQFFSGSILTFYDSSQTFVSGFPTYSGTDIFTDEVVDVPDGASYVVLGDNSALNSSVDSVTFAFDTGREPKRDIWNDKTWIAFGDSLTEENTRTTMHYHDYIADETGISVINMGLSGSGYMKLYGDSNAFYQRVANIDTSAGVITFFGSGNDGTYWSTALGEVTDTGTDTLCGCINTTFDTLFELAPLMPVGVISPTPWEGGEPSDQSSGWINYVAALEDICKLRGIPFLNLYYESNLHPDSDTFKELAYSNDDGNGVHPDETGHAIIAPRIKAFLETLIRID